MSKQQIMLVAKVALVTVNSTHLLITATGQVPMPGWSNPELVPYIYIQAPPDGIYDFDFVGEPPRGPALSLAKYTLDLSYKRGHLGGVPFNHCASVSIVHQRLCAVAGTTLS